jgi:dTDP-glucose pyrophosphorylase
MLNIVIPMAGAGLRFANAGYEYPKPLIPIKGVPMVRLVINNLRPSIPHRFIFICQANHVQKYGLDMLLQQWAPGSVLLSIEGLTEGAACTVLNARELIDTDSPLMIANSDQWINHSIDDYLQGMARTSSDGFIMTMHANDPKWSFVGLDAEGCVARVVEKLVISTEATVGIYNFLRGADFVAAADEMISNNLRVNGEFYVAPVYNSLIVRGYKIRVYNIGKVEKAMYGLGTPADLQTFISLPVLARALKI